MMPFPILKCSTKPFYCLFLILFLPAIISAQKDSVPFITTLRMEVRADFDFTHNLAGGTPADVNNNVFGFKGRYFNIEVGGNFGKKFSYYFRQRVVANPGSTTFFDNTDFLYLNYAINPQWSLRFGKEALAVGGFEYDAPPIDVLFCSYYWDNFYCFQLAASGAWHSPDGKHTLIAQVGASPYLHYGSFYKNSLMSYNFFWSGDFGHFKTLYSVNMFERERGKFMNYIALGNKLSYDRWSWYVDFIHHATHLGQLMRNFAVITRADVFFNDNVSLFAKGGYEQNFDRKEILNHRATGEIWDCLALPGQQYIFGGLGVEIRPRVCPDVRIHAFVADVFTRNLSESIALEVPAVNAPSTHSITANVGLTWNINFMKYLKNK